MEHHGISHRDVWDETFACARESLQELRDYVHGVRNGIVDPQDEDLADCREFGLTTKPSVEVDDALEMAEVMLGQLECELHEASPDEARDAVVKVMRENLDAHLFEGQSHTSYQLCNDMIEVLGMHYHDTCVARNVPAHAFLQQRIFGTATQYAEISRCTVEAMAGRVQAIMKDEGMKDTGIVTPYEFAAERVMQHKNRAANDDGCSLEDEMTIQQTARSVMGCTVDGFYPVPFDKMCPEMALMIESLTYRRSQRNVPYRAPASEEAMSDAVSRDFGAIYRACPNMHEDIGQLLQAVGRANPSTGPAASVAVRL